VGKDSRGDATYLQEASAFADLCHAGQEHQHRAQLTLSKAALPCRHHLPHQRLRTVRALRAQNVRQQVLDQLEVQHALTTHTTRPHTKEPHF